ncbi:hypothetical protein BV25DRAFT_852205 [Artomyces pyxidatus]|uniref:Uncharacterized protein n=1 Tax=Artomyces pyxidatus TaxID=48021 RepID=A0ACB8TGY7_9AGAM|nr:hypothetical protein BV25DRAFT_852205 [Artomyces pyxidatus]
MNKPVLYLFHGSVWSAAAELAVADLNYSDKVEKQVVNLLEGENFDPSFIKINGNATLSTMTADGRSYCNTADVVSYIVKHAPVRAAPGTSMVEEIHAAELDPNFVTRAIRDEAELKEKGSGLAKKFQTRIDALQKYSATPEAAPYKSFYSHKLADLGGLLALATRKKSETEETAFFKASQEAWAAVKRFLYDTLPARLEQGAFLAGDRPGEDDFHVGAWMARIAMLTGASAGNEGLEKLQDAFGAPLPDKIAKYWEAWIRRESWKEVYAAGLH